MRDNEHFGKNLWMRKKYLSAVIASVVASGSLVTAGAADMEAGLGGMLQPAKSLGPSDAMVEQVVEARKKFGFKHDPTFVRDLLTRPEKYHALVGRMTGGHYATPDEAQELAVRLRVQEEAIKIMRDSRTDPDFAGLYVDQKGKLHIGFTKSGKEKMKGFQKASKYPARVQAFKADRSLAELETLQQGIVEAGPKLVSNGIQVSEVAVDISNNTVRVGVVDLDASKRKALTSQFPGVEVFEEALDIPDNRSDTANPMRAGVAITGCTSAWKAQDRSTGDLVMLTAGHCASGATGTLGGAPANVFQGTNTNGSQRLIGTSDQNTWTFPTVNPDGSRSGAGPVDAMRMPLVVGSLPWLYAYDDANTGVFDDGEAVSVGDVDGSVVVGTSVCLAGRNSPGNQVGGGDWKNCGTVSAVNVARTFVRSSGSVDRFTLQNANVADYVSIPGDSGGPVWRLFYTGSDWEPIAVGINTGGSGGEKFSDIDRVEDALNVDIRQF